MPTILRIGPYRIYFYSRNYSGAWHFFSKLGITHDFIMGTNCVFWWIP